MLRNIFKRLLYWCWNNLRWNNEKRWCDESRVKFLKEAANFLIQKGLLNDKDDIEKLAKNWNFYVKKLFNSEQPENFYYSWQGKAGASNIAANIKDQFNRPYILHNLAKVLNLYKEPSITMLDFGCGTAALSIAFQDAFAKNSQLLLADVENLPREFVRIMRKKKVELVDIGLGRVKENSVDIVLCIHILEHIKNPTQVFKLIHGKIKNGGFILLEAPWGKELEHIKESPIDWKIMGGEKFLTENYTKICSLNPFVIWSGGVSGCYKKIIG